MSSSAYIDVFNMCLSVVCIRGANESSNGAGPLVNFSVLSINLSISQHSAISLGCFH